MTEQLELEKKVFRWSFSQWEAYNQCPSRWKYKSVLRIPGRPAGPAAARGSDLHARVERYIEDGVPIHEAIISPELDAQARSMYTAGCVPQGPPWEQLGDVTKSVWYEKVRGFKMAQISPKYQHILDEFRAHSNGAMHVELKLAFDEEWRLTSNIHKEASVVMVLDAVRAGGAWAGREKGQDDGKVFVAEWKSGKPKETHGDQRKIYALGALLKFMADEAEVTTYYLEDTAPPQKLAVKATAIPKLIAIWDERRNLMQRDEMCAPRPGDYCRWCDYAQSKGGPCKFG